MVLFKGEYSVVIYCKCLNEEINVRLALKFSQNICSIVLLQQWATTLSQSLLNRSFYQGMVRFSW